MDKNLEQLDDIETVKGDDINPRVVDEKIRILRTQLRDTYNLLINCRDMLSTVSFEKMKEQSSSANENLFHKDDVNEIVGAKSVADSLVVLKQKINNISSETGYASTSFPEVNSFFGALTALNQGMKEIQGHRESLNNLNADVHHAILEFEKSITENRIKFEDLDTMNNKDQL